MAETIHLQKEPMERERLWIRGVAIWMGIDRQALDGGHTPGPEGPDPLWSKRPKAKQAAEKLLRFSSWELF
jgi:hypothetical protein